MTEGTREILARTLINLGAMVMFVSAVPRPEVHYLLQVAILYGVTRVVDDLACLLLFPRKGTK